MIKSLFEEEEVKEKKKKRGKSSAGGSLLFPEDDDTPEEQEDLETVSQSTDDSDKKQAADNVVPLEKSESDLEDTGEANEQMLESRIAEIDEFIKTESEGDATPTPTFEKLPEDEVGSGAGNADSNAAEKVDPASPPVKSDLSVTGYDDSDNDSKTSDKPDHEIQPFTPDKPGESMRKTGLAYSAGIALFGSVFFMLILGWFADLLLGIQPWGTVIGISIGTAIGMMQLFRITSRIYRPKPSDFEKVSLRGQETLETSEVVKIPDVAKPSDDTPQQKADIDAAQPLIDSEGSEKKEIDQPLLELFDEPDTAQENSADKEHISSMDSAKKD